MTLEFDDEVLSYEEQLLRINYAYKDGISYRYTPDCLVTYHKNILKLNMHHLYSIDLYEIQDYLKQ